MTKHSEKRSALVAALSDHVLVHGLQKSSLRQLAAAAKTSDRMLLYYFKNRDDLVAEILMHIAVRMQADLDHALPVGNKPMAASKLVPHLARLIRNDQFRPYMIFWLEAAVAAARGEQPHASISGALMDGFVDWLKNRLPRDDHDQAYLILTMVDGITFMEAAGRGPQATKAVNRWAQAKD